MLRVTSAEALLRLPKVLVASATSLVQAWLPPVTGLVAAIGVLVGVIKGLGDYHLRVKAQASEAYAKAAETDVRLAEAFAQLAATANGRNLSSTDVGLSTQVAAIAALAELATRHPTLDEPGRAALNRLSGDFQDNPVLREVLQAAIGRLHEAPDDARNDAQAAQSAD
jgi:hypothetical protein